MALCLPMILILSERLVVITLVVHCMVPLILLILNLPRGLVLNGSNVGVLELPSVLVVLPSFVSVLSIAPLAVFLVSALTTRRSLVRTSELGDTK